MSVYRRETGIEEVFRLDSPATSERIRMACVDKFTQQVSDSRPTVLKLNILGKLNIKSWEGLHRAKWKRPGYIACVRTVLGTETDAVQTCDWVD